MAGQGYLGQACSVGLARCLIRLIRSYSAQALASLCAVAAFVAMDSLSTGTLMRLFEMLPNGPVKEIIQIMARSHCQCENCVETSLCTAMTHVFSIARFRDAMLADWGVSDVSLLATVAAPTPPPQPALCGKCQGPIEHPFEFRDVDYCCMQCCHDAGDYRYCIRIRGGCGCTGFAIKRRQLRQHRQRMRAMQQLIIDHDLEDDLHELTGEYPGDLDDPFDLALDVQMDEGSDTEDPMVTQANELSNIDNIVQLSRNMVELAEARRGQKRTRGSDQGA